LPGLESPGAVAYNGLSLFSQVSRTPR